MNKRKTLIIGLSFAIFVVFAMVGLTYAFFTASVGGNDRASSTIVETAELKLVFSDTQKIEMNEALPGQSVTKTFTVENRGDVEIEYTIDIENLTNTFVNGDLVYSLTSTNGGATANRKVLPTSAGTLETASIAPGITQTYTIEILFKETGSNQNTNQSAIFGGVLQINSNGEYRYVPKWYNTCNGNENNLNCRVIATNTTQSDVNIDYAYTSEGITWTYNSDMIMDESQITNGLYYTEENTEGNERVYFYRGVVENNYLVFGTHQTDYKEIRGYYSSTSSNYERYNSLAECNNASSANFNCEEVTLASAGSAMCWRILRTVEDGSVRLRYGGAATQNGDTYTCPQTGTAVNIGTNQQYFTSDSNKNDVNYKTSSIRTTVENWYRDNIWKNGQNTKVTNLIADTPYCNDMSERNVNEYLPIYDSYFYFTYFGAYDRLNFHKTNASSNPQYKCPNSTYAYTVAKGDLTYPVGLLTADEVAYAGGVLGINTENFSYYLNTGEAYWTMTPFDFSDWGANVFLLQRNGSLLQNTVDRTYAAVPAVSLKPEATVKRGTGLYNDPFVINTD